MSTATIDRDDPRPLHVQIRSILQKQILDQTLPPGQQLPTEEELQHQFGVSRSVVRQALSGLAAGGLIQRQRGRGSVVRATPVLHRRVQRAGGLGEEAAARGQQLSTRVLSLDAVPASMTAQVALNTSRTWKIERIRYLEDTPMVFMRTWVPRDLFPHFTPELLENASLLELMRESGYPPAGGPRQVQAVAADDVLAEGMEVAVGDPLLLLEGVTQDATGRGLESFSVWHRANTVFDVDAQATASGAVSAEEVQHLRSLVREFDTALTRLGSNALE